MKTNNSKFRKRAKSTTNPASPFARSLREARNLLRSGDKEAGYAQLNQLAASTKNPQRRGKISLCIGEDQFLANQYQQSARTFEVAMTYARQAQDLQNVLKAGIGSIRCALRSLQTAEALQMAEKLIEEIKIANQSLDQLSQMTPDQLRNQGVVAVPARPPRLSVALTKLGQAFMEAGETATAVMLLKKVTTQAPNGGARARQSLARLALAADNPELAERHARESLQMGRFQAKTVVAWEQDLIARARLGKTPILENDLWASFQANSKGRVLARSTLIVVQVLRAYGDSSWKNLAREFLSKQGAADAVIATEIEKILHADAKLTRSEPPVTIAARSLNLFRAASCSANEQIAHAKSYVQNSLLAGEVPKFTTITNLATKKYGGEHATKIIHAAALGAMKAQRHDIARVMLTSQINGLTAGGEQWGRDLWALARMEEAVNNYPEAAYRYFEFAKNEVAPARFRIHAMLKGFTLLEKSKQPVNTPELAATIKSLIAQMNDYQVAFDAARQLSFTGGTFPELRIIVSEKALQLANEELKKATTATAQLAILEYSARKLHFDIHNDAAVIRYWENLTPVTINQFASDGGSVWYNYLAVVFLSYIDNKQADKALALAEQIINGESSTPEGYVIVGTEYALYNMRQGNVKKAMETFEWIAKESPTHRRAAHAHYWLALRFLKTGNEADAKSACAALRICFSGKPALLSEWELDSSALMILNDYNTTVAPEKNGVCYTISFLELSVERIQTDLGKLSK